MRSVAEEGVPHIYGAFSAMPILKGVAHMATGKVKWFNDQKGFGFISAEDGTDVFVHHSVIEGQGFHTLAEGESVDYAAEGGPKGQKATRVKRVDQMAASMK